MLPDPSVSVGIVMSGKCVAGGSVANCGHVTPHLVDGGPV